MGHVLSNNEEVMSSIDESNYYRLDVVADFNDADYLETSNKISGKDLVRFISIMVRLKVNKWNNRRWTTQDQIRSSGDYASPQVIHDLTDDEVEFVNGFIPYHEYGIHTIDSVSYSEWTDEIKLF